MISDADRRRLHDALVKSIGPKPSEVLMELLPRAGWTDLATRTDIDIAKTELRIEIQDLRNEVRNLTPKLVAANIASMLGVASVVLAAGALF